MLTTFSFDSVKFAGFFGGGAPRALWVKICSCSCNHSSSLVSLCLKEEDKWVT